MAEAAKTRWGKPTININVIGGAEVDVAEVNATPLSELISMPSQNTKTCWPDEPRMLGLAYWPMPPML